MTQLFEIKEVEGKGLGWVATKNIKRGTVIFTEKPQLALNCCSEKQMESGNRVQVILFEIDCAIFYTDLHELLCQFIS